MAMVLLASCAGSTYFPADEGAQFIYGDSLRAASEPILRPTRSSTREILRFTWVPSFHPSITVTVTRTGDQITLVAKRLTGAGDEPGRVGRQLQTQLSLKQWTQLVSLLTAADFWKAPSERPRKFTDKGEEIIGLDGAGWLFEWADSERYHYVDRWWHEDYPPLESLGLCLVEWSGIPDEDFLQYLGARRPTSRCT